VYNYARADVEDSTSPIRVWRDLSGTEVTAMRLGILILMAILLLTFATDLFAVFPRQPVLGRMFISADRLHAFEPNTSAGVASGTASDVSLGIEIGPNPVRPSAAITYSVPASSKIPLRVHDVRGRLVKTVFDGMREPGQYRAEWNGRNDEGAEVGAGIYFVRLDVGTLHVAKKAVLVR
jgi:FlgD Ig-like domain